MDKMAPANMSLKSLAVLVLIAVLVYLRSLGNGFVWDDIPLIVDPSPLQNLGNIRQFFTGGVSAGTSFGEAVPYYRPLFTLSLAIDYAVWGASAFGFHLTNIFYHALASILVARLTMELLKGRSEEQARSGALAAGLIFAVHPVHAEAVAYIAARNELLCTIFALAALLLHCRLRRGRRWYFLLLPLVLYFFSLLSKEMSITLPALVFLLEIALFRTGFVRALSRSIPYAAVAGGYLVLRGAVLASFSWESPPFTVRLATAFSLMSEYLRLLVIPWPLRVLHDVPVRWSFTDPAVIAGAVLILLTAGFLLFICRRSPLFFCGGVWILLTLLPVSGLPVFISPALIAERYLYLPSVGISLLIGLAVAGRKDDDWHLPRIRPALAAGLALLAVFGILTARQSIAWHDQEQFCLRMIADAPEHPLGYHELGNWYGKQKRYAEMASAYQYSLELTLVKQDRTGRVYLARGEFDRAEREYQKLVNAKLTSGSIHNNLGLACLGQGKIEEALDNFRKALEFEPDNAEFAKNLQRAEREKGR